LKGCMPARAGARDPRRDRNSRISAAFMISGV
jgi:hypothetical protein